MNVAETPVTSLINSGGSAQQQSIKDTSLELSCAENAGTSSAQPSMNIRLLTPKDKQPQQQQSQQQLSPHPRNSESSSSSIGGRQRRPSSTLSTTESADSGCSFGGSSPINFTANRSAVAVFDAGCANTVASSAGGINSSSSPSSSLSCVSSSANCSTSRHHNDSPTSRQRLLAELNAFVTLTNNKCHDGESDGGKNPTNSSGAVASLLSPPTTIITSVADNNLNTFLQERHHHQQQQEQEQQQCLLLAPPLPQQQQQQHERGRNLLGRRTASTNAMKALNAASNAAANYYAPAFGNFSEPPLLISSNSTPCLFDGNAKMSTEWELQKRNDINRLTTFHRNASPLANELYATATAAVHTPITPPPAAFSDITQYINPEIHGVQVSELAAQQQQQQQKQSAGSKTLKSGCGAVAHHRQPSPGRQQQQHDTYKTVMCQAWLESTRCSFGENCKFAHGEMELRPVKVQARNNGKYKTKLCEKYTTTGICPYGSRCLFIHPIPNSNNNNSNNNNKNNNTKLGAHRSSPLFQKTQSSIQFPIFAASAAMNNNSLSASNLNFDRGCRSVGDASSHHVAAATTRLHERRWLTDIQQPFCDAMRSQQHSLAASAAAECQHHHQHHHHFRSSSMSSTMMMQMSCGKELRPPQLCDHGNKMCGGGAHPHLHHHQQQQQLLQQQQQQQQTVSWSQETIDMLHQAQQQHHPPPSHNHFSSSSSSSSLAKPMKPVIGRGATDVDSFNSAFLSRHVPSANDHEFAAATLHVPKSSFRPFQRGSTTNHFFGAATSTAEAAAAGDNNRTVVLENNNNSTNRLYRPAPVSLLRRLNSANTFDHSGKYNNNNNNFGLFGAGGYEERAYSGSTTSSSSNGLFDGWPSATTTAIVAHHGNTSSKLSGTAASCLSLLSSSSGLSDNNENGNNACNCCCMNRSNNNNGRVTAATTAAAAASANSRVSLTRNGMIASTLEKIPSLSLSDEDFLAIAEAESATAVNVSRSAANMVTTTATGSVGFEQLYNTLDHMIVRNHHDAKNGSTLKCGNDVHASVLMPESSSIQHGSIGDLVREMELQSLEEYLIASERRMAMERPRQQYPYYCFDDDEDDGDADGVYHHNHHHHNDVNDHAHHRLESGGASLAARVNTAEKWAAQP